MNPTHLERRSVAEQAALWLEEIDSSDSEQSAAFLKWLKASPLHVHEFLLAARVRDAVRKVDPERRMDVEMLIAAAGAGTNVRALDGRAVSAPRPRNQERRWIALASVAASVLLICVVLAYLSMGNAYSTERGEQRMVKLEDGSVIFLNTDSRIRVQYSDTGRDIVLKQGQALFQVQGDAARPFRVHAAAAMVQALGTQFDVRLKSNRASVAVVEGAVQVASERLDAGQGVTVEASGQVTPPYRIDAYVVTAWRQQRLIFHDTPLSEIADEFNRYNSAPRIRVEGNILRARRFDGSFHALRPESFLNYLGQDQRLVFERRRGEVLIKEVPR